MQIRGLDYSSAKLGGKRSFVAYGEFDDGVLTVSRLEDLRTGLDGLVCGDGSWVLGLDFPFGLPRVFVEAQGWDRQWEQYARMACDLPWADFERRISEFRDARPEGQKQPGRQVDRLARSRSPLMTVRTPVARMFHAAAGVISDCPCDVLPFRNTGADRVIVEAYPAVLVRRLVGTNPYKDGATEEPRCREVRDTIMRRICRGDLEGSFGLRVRLAESVRQECLEDPQADALDSVLCLIQAAWSYGQRAAGWGVPSSVDRAEGWIVDPGLVVLMPNGAPTPIRADEPLPTPQPKSFNSSATRVRPVFDELLAKDSSAADWLPKLLRLSCRNHALADRLASATAGLSNAGIFERRLPPPTDLLEWCLENASVLATPRSAEKVSPSTKRKRLALRGELGEEALKAALEEAREALKTRGAAGSGGQWWAFEGFTSVDCCLEADRGLLLIEGKRFESPSESVSWIEGRNQISRNLEVAAQAVRESGREYGVILIGPSGTRGPTDSELRRGWPHLSVERQNELLTHYLGAVGWQEVCAATGVDYDSLPITAPDVVEP